MPASAGGKVSEKLTDFNCKRRLTDQFRWGGATNRVRGNTCSGGTSNKAAGEGGFIIGVNLIRNARLKNARGGYVAEGRTGPFELQAGGRVLWQGTSCSEGGRGGG